MLIEIEQAILALFDEKVLLPFRKMGIGKADGKGPKNLSIPKCMVGIQSGTAEKQTQAVSKVTARVFVFIEFSSLRDEEARRKGAYPIVEAVIQYLNSQTLGLAIGALNFIRFDNTTSEDDAAIGLVNFTLQFSTHFTFRVLPDEAAALVTLGLKYYLDREDDDLVDLEGRVSLVES